MPLCQSVIQQLNKLSVEHLAIQQENIKLCYLAEHKEIKYFRKNSHHKMYIA